MKIKYIPYKISNWYYDRKWDIITFFQRGKRGWGDRDTWSFDGYLAGVIAEGLEHLKETKCGTPISMFPEDSKFESTDEISNRARAKWDITLDIMIKAFKLTKDIAYQDIWPYHEDGYKSDNIRMLTQEEEAIIKEGFKLFAENFHSFWD